MLCCTVRALKSEGVCVRVKFKPELLARSQHAYIITTRRVFSSFQGTFILVLYVHILLLQTFMIHLCVTGIPDCNEEALSVARALNLSWTPVLKTNDDETQTVINSEEVSSYTEIKEKILMIVKPSTTSFYHHSCAVFRPHQRAGLSLHYPEGQISGGRRPPYQLQTQGLVDIPAAVLGHAHPRGALWILWCSCSPRGGVTRYSAKGSISHRKRGVASGSSALLGQLQMSQVGKVRTDKHLIWML